VAPGSIGPWVADADARPLRGWDAASLARVAAALEPVVGGWQAAWGLPAPAALTVRVADARDLDRAAWHCVGTSGSGRAWLGSQPCGSGAEWLDSPEGAWARQVSVLCRSDLLERLGDWLRVERQVTEGPPPPALARPWSGAVIVKDLCDAGWSLVLDADAAFAKLPAAKKARAPGGDPLVGAADALASRRVHLRVELRACELQLGMLQSLEPGDVIPLDHPLSEPLQVTGADGGVELAGFLGRMDGHKAVELALARRRA